MTVGQPTVWLSISSFRDPAIGYELIEEILSNHEDLMIEVHSNLQLNLQNINFNRNE